MDDAGAHEDSPFTWAENDARSGGEENLESLPETVRAIVEECRAQSRQASAADAVEEALPYPCRMYEEAMPGEDDLLQLQWMRVDMSSMDGERCWGESPRLEEHDCSPDSGVFLPSVYSLDPTQLIACTPIGLPPELQRARESNSDAFDQRAPEEVPEDHLCKLGRKVTEALAIEPSRHRQRGDLLVDVVGDVTRVSAQDWSLCLERYVDLPRCDPVMLAQVLSTAPPPTLDCLLGMVLPALISRMSQDATAAIPATQEEGTSDDSSSGGCGSSRARLREIGEADEWVGSTARNTGRDIAVIHAICKLAASVAAPEDARRGMEAGGLDPAQFREKVSGSELRKLGALGREAEVALAEAFFYGGIE